MPVLRLAAFAAAFLTATSVQAQSGNFYSPSPVVADERRVAIGTIVSPADGVLSLYQNMAGSPGALLGSRRLRAGVNGDYYVHLPYRPRRSLIAVIEVDGAPVASKVFRIQRD